MLTAPMTKPILDVDNHKAQRFGLWLGIVSMSMLFAGFTSAYIVRKAAGNWDYFEMPPIFYLSTFLIVLSSCSLHMAHISNKQNKKGLLLLGLLITFILGGIFGIIQFVGWNELSGQGIFIEGSGGKVSGSFFYVITIGHFTHVIGGMIVLSIALLRSFWLFKKKGLDNTFQESKFVKFHIRTDLITIFWHFLGVLWIYLFVFLNLNH